MGTQFDHVPIAVIGSGFSGIAMGVGLSRAGRDFVIFERAADVGGTWRDNTYPGCRCDVPSHLYSLSFAPNPAWTETYSTQPEIGAYLRRTAEEFGLLDHIRFDHTVRQACWDPVGGHWRIETDHGTCTADVVISGHGAFAEPSIPDLPGAGRFEGTVMHSARWDHGHDLGGERVAVIGTGASAVQVVPAIQPEVAHLTVFQRTAPWVLPHTNRRITRVERALYRRVPLVQRVVRAGVYWSRELAARGFIRNGLSAARWLGRWNIRRAIADPDLRARVTPDYAPGCKRLLLSNDWYPALTQPNVDLVTDAIAEIRPRSIVTSAGQEIPVDTIVYGTGFRVTDNPVNEALRGVDGRTLRDLFAETGIGALHGTTVPGFPNFFMLTGPNTGIGHTSLVVMIEAQVGYVLQALETVDRGGAVAPTMGAFRAWLAEMDERTAPTVWASGCSSWYLDADGRNSTLWPGLTVDFVRRLRRFDPDLYEVVPARSPAVVA